VEDHAADAAAATPSNAEAPLTITAGGEVLLTTHDVARITGHTYATLQQYRADRVRTGREVGPAFVKRGRFCYYPASAVEVYVAARKGA